MPIVNAYGKRINFPDDMSHEEIANIISSNEKDLNPDYKAPESGGARSFIENNFLGFSTKEKPSIADQAEASAEEGANTAAPQVKGAPVRQSFYNKALLDPSVGANAKDGIISRTRKSADEDVKGQVQQREIEGLRTDENVPEGGFVALAKSQFGQSVKSAGQVGYDYFGADKDNALIKYGEEILRENPAAIKSLQDIADRPFLAFKEASGNMVPSFGAMLGTAALGQGIISVSPLTGPLAPVVAAVGAGVKWLGPAAIAALPSYGSIRDKQIFNDKANQDDWRAKAVAGLGAAAVGGIEVAFGPQNWAISMLTKEGRAALARKFAATTPWDAFMKGGLIGGATELGEEITQTPIEQLSAFENPLTKKNIEETKFSGAMAFIGGFAPGGVTSTANYISQQAQIKADRINAERAKLGLDKIIKSTNVDEAINAANESVSQKPVDKEDVLRAADPTLADIERLTGLKPSESLESAQAQQSIPSQASQENNQTQRDTEIVLPDNKTLPAQWDIVDADTVKASLKNGESQPRDRTRAASDLQIQSIAKNPDYRRLSDSPVMDIGAPVLSNDGQIVGGNGRFEALSRAYDQSTAQEYLDNLRKDAIKKGIDPAVIDQMKKPVLVRRITQPFDTRQLAIASNSGTSAQYSDLEQAKIDSDRLSGIEDIVTTDNGDIALTADNIKRVRDSLGNYTPAEIAPFVDANGQLSQQGIKRIRNAMLAKAYGDNKVIQSLIESNDSDIRNILGALTRVVGDAVKSQSTAPKESNVTPSILEAVNIYSQLKQSKQPVLNYLNQQDAFSDKVNPAVENILMFLDKNARSQPKLTEFFRDAYTKLGSIDTKTPDIFGQEVKPKPEDLFAKQKISNEPSATLKRDSSWIIRNKNTGEVLFETFDKEKVDKLNTDKYEAIPALKYLQEINSNIKEDNLATELQKHLKKNGYEFDVKPVTEREFNELDNTKKAQKELAEKQAKIFGKKVVFVKTKGKFGINGVMVPAIKDTIFIDLNTPKPFHAVMAHELSHWMEQENPAAYKDMLGALKDIIVNEDGYRKKYGITDQTKGLIPREIAGDLMGDNFTKPEFWDKVAQHNPSKFQEIAKAIIKWLKNIVLKAKARGMGSEEWVTDAKKAQDIIAKAVSQYTKEQDAVGEKVEFKKKSESELKLSKEKQEKLPETIKELEKYWDAKGISNFISEKNGVITLSKIVIPKDRRDSGLGTIAMNDLIGYADRTGQRIDLTPSSDFGGTKSRLISFYKKFGFVENKGRNKDYSISELMFRYPVPSNVDVSKTLPDTINIDGTERPTTNSEGKPIYPTEEGVRNFWRWFGDSKVVDDQGRPLVVYHGGKSNGEGISVFDEKFSGSRTDSGWMGKGFYFGDSRTANVYAGHDELNPDMFPVNGTVYPSYLRLTNPAILIDSNKNYGARTLVRELADLPEESSSEEVRSKLLEDGYDGAIYRRTFSTKSYSEFVAFNSNQIKSAIGNNGEFDKSNNNILFSKTTKQQDDEYLQAVKDGDIEKAQKMVDAAARDKGYISGNEYRMMHQAPNREDYNLASIKESGIVPDDYWTHPQYYQSDAIERQSFNKVNAAIDRQKRTGRKAGLSVYRSVPKNVKDSNIRNGDWVTPSIEYARMEGESIPGGYRIISAIPNIDNLWWDANSINELGYDDGKEYAYKNTKNNRKLIDSVTYDDEGNIIPLSKRFNSRSDDVRFSAQKPFNPNEDIEETKARKAQRVGQDKFNRFNAVKEFLAKEKGINISEAADVYKAEERYYGKVANQQEDFRNKVRNPLVEKIAKAGYKLDEVEKYLLNRHAQEANAQNRKLTGKDDSTAYGISDQEAKDYLAKAPKELAKLADEVQALTNKAQQMRLDNGIETQERIDAMNGAYKYYVPVRGDAESQQKQNKYRGTGKGFDLKYKPKRRLGHELRSEGVIENIFQDYERAIMQVEKNRVGKSLALMAAEIQMPELISINQPVKRKILRTDTAFTVEHDGEIRGVFHTMPEAQMFKKVLEGGLFEGKPSSNITINKTSDQRLIYSASPMLADNEVMVYMNGHEVRLQINDELMARAYKNMGVEALGSILSVGRAVNGWMSKAYTGYNPEFLPVNIQRDFTTGFVNLTGEQGILIAGKAVANYPKSFASLLKYAATGESDKWIDAYRDNGGNTGAAYLPDLERLGEEVRKEYASYQGVIANLKEGDSANALRAAGRKTFNATLKYIEHLNSAGENAFRLATFKAMIESGKSVNEAASMAKNVTVNFNRKGEIGAELNALYLFFNASLQGTAATSHALFKGRHKYQAWGLAGSMMAVGYLTASMLGGFDDEDKYDEISDATKSRNLIMSYGDGYIKIPVPYGYGYFYNAGRMYAEAQRKGELGKMPYQLMALATEEFSPFNVASTEDSEFNSRKVSYGLLPTVARIPMEITNNFSSFTGRELYPEKEWYKSEPDNEKMWRGTKGTVYDISAQYLASIGIEISPETLKYMARTATGGSGAFVDTSISSAMLKKEGAELETREIPFVRKFYGENTIQDARSRYGKAKEEVSIAFEKFNALRQKNDIASIRTFIDDKRELLALNSVANKLSDVIKIIRDQQDEIKISDKYTTAEKRLKIKELENQEKKYYDMFMSKYKNVKKH